MITTKRKFWEVLKSIPGWRLDGEGKIRTSDKSKACPVCAVANKLLDTTVFWLNAWDAAAAIGLDDRFAHQIQIGADDYEYKTSNHKIHKFLLKLLGLTCK